MLPVKMLRFRPYCRFKALCKLISVSVCLTFVCTLMVVNFYISYNSCSVNKASQEIQDLCALYYRNEVAGNMCHKLCDENAFSLSSCGNNRQGGKNVFLMECRGCEPLKSVSKIVMKAQYDMSRWDREINGEIVINKSESIEKSIESIKIHIADHIKVYFGKDYSKMKNFMSFMWGQDFDKYIRTIGTKKAAQVAATSIAALGMQREYISMRLVGEKSYMPKLYGTCGPAYFVENTPSFLKLGLVLFQGKLPEILSLTFASWKERAVIALKMIKLLKTIETSFEIPMHMCDIRSDNVGVNDRNEITLLDSDSIWFGSPVADGNQSCVTDNQCDWLSCYGYCNQTTNTCGGKRINNNLQVVCRFIFLSSVEKFGLLRNAPRSIKTELYKTLQQCVYGEKVVNGIHWRNPQSDVMNKIHNLVYSTLNSL